MDVLEEIEFSPSDVIRHVNVSVSADQVLEDTEFFTVRLISSLGTIVDTLRASVTVNISDSTTGTYANTCPQVNPLTSVSHWSGFKVKLTFPVFWL